MNLPILTKKPEALTAEGVTAQYLLASRIMRNPAAYSRDEVKAASEARDRIIGDHLPKAKLVENCTLLIDKLKEKSKALRNSSPRAATIVATPKRTAEGEANEAALLKAARAAAGAVFGNHVRAMDDAHLVALLIDEGVNAEIGLSDKDLGYSRPQATGIERAMLANKRIKFASALKEAQSKKNT